MATALEARDTVAVQIVFIMTGIVVPLLGLGYVLGHPVESFSWHSGSTLYLAVILGATVLAWGCLLLARAGFLRLSLHGFLIVIPLLILCLHTGAGLREQAFVWVMALPPLALAGMVSGRRTLWLMLLFLQCCVLAGALHDLFFAGNPLGVPEVVAAVIVLSSGLLAAAILFDVMAAMIGAGLDDIRIRDQQLEATERRIREGEEQREKVVGHLIHGQKTKAMGQLAGGIVHDLNNILGIILGYAQWHQRRSRPEDLKKALISVENAAHRGVAVSRKLLGFSRYDVNHREVFDIGEALFSLRGTLRQLFDPRVSISVTPVDISLPIRFDRDEFELAILNIASNARDAMPEGGHFEISVALDEASESGAWVRVDLQDNGCGMSRAVQQRIFEPSFTTKRSSGGNGLGLAVVSMIVSESGGRAQVESSPGQGTCITLTLPLVQRTLLARVRGGAAPRVLLVDNDTALRATLTAALEGKGCQVLCARESAEAERLVRRGDVPDVLVMDYHMPDINGPALIHRLRADYPALPVVLTTDYSLGIGTLADRVPPDVEWLLKPFPPGLLVEYVYMLISWSETG